MGTFPLTNGQRKFEQDKWLPGAYSNFASRLREAIRARNVIAMRSNNQSCRPDWSAVFSASGLDGAPVAHGPCAWPSEPASW
jgi:hypothetical protein